MGSLEDVDDVETPVSVVTIIRGAGIPNLYPRPIPIGEVDVFEASSSSNGIVVVVIVIVFVASSFEASSWMNDKDDVIGWSLYDTIFIFFEFTLSSDRGTIFWNDSIWRRYFL